MSTTKSIYGSLLLIPLMACLSVGAHAQTSAAPRQTEITAPSTSNVIEATDLHHLRAVNDPRLSPDGRTVLFSVQYHDRVGRPYSRIWQGDLRSGTTAPWGADGGIQGSSARWSPDGKRVAYRAEGGIHVADATGGNARLLAPVEDTNHPLPRAGKDFVWSPDGSTIAFVSAVASADPPMEHDPIVITRYLYRPESGWPSRFNDNKRVHLFTVDVASGKVTQRTQGDRYEHSADWSPDGKTLVFLQNPEHEQDKVYNYDIFTLDVASGKVNRITQTRGVEYAPVFSPDGKKLAFSGLMRPVTSSETNMENPSTWVMDLASGARVQVGAGIDEVQGRPQWSVDGRWVYFTVQSRGSVGLYRVPTAGGQSERIGPALNQRGSVSSFAVAADGTVAAAMTTPTDLAQLYRLSPGREAVRLSNLNDGLLAKKRLATVEAFTFKSYDEREIEAFLTVPAGVGGSSARHSHPMIVAIHGGPHGQQGPGFVTKAQIYAAQGYAVLMVNYRGSTGYGQAFANAIARDQNGGEAMDVMRAVDAAIERHSWIDPERLGIEGGSYGGQLTNWIITQTPRFKAAIPWASISNLVSHNYMSVYHDYLEQEYFGKPHTAGIMDMLWLRSPLRFVHQVRTPVLLSHGDNDLLVNPAEIEQYFTALHDVGVEAVMLRYPREGHGMRESQNQVDFAQRSIDWYEKHFNAR
jgi:dipeptidyl aminopeptidase/acylaminoacyl peptidase